MTRAQSLSAVLLALALAAACARPAAPPTPAAAPVADPPVATSAELVERMKSRYRDSWYRTLTFTQNNTRYKDGGGEERSQWKEYQRVPGRLRVEFLPAESGSGFIFRDDTIHAFNNGVKERSAPQIHPLLLLSADLYAIPTDRTLHALDSLRIDRRLVRQDRWQGRPAHVVGAAAGDSVSSQFWVDAERLLLVRLVTSQQAAGRTVITDYHFTYQDVAGRPVPKEILFHRDGTPYWREEYVDVTVDAELSDELFDPTRWKAAKE